MSQRMYDDRRLRIAMVQHEAAENARLRAQIDQLTAHDQAPAGAPERGAPIDDWLKWREETKRAGIRWYRLDELPKWSGYTIAQLKYKSSLRKPRGTPKTPMKKGKKLKKLNE